jgi:hypothetical protein
VPNSLSVGFDAWMVPYSVVFNSTCASKISSYKQEFQKKEREIREKIAARYLKKAVRKYRLHGRADLQYVQHVMMP